MSSDAHPPSDYSAYEPATIAREALRQGRSRLVVVGVVLVVVVLLCCCCVSSAMYFFFLRDGGGPTYSADQTRVIEEFGEPQTFRVLVAEDDRADFDASGALPVARYEFWHYWDAGSTFVFREGALLRADALDGPPDDTPLAFPEFSPGDFTGGESPDDVCRALDALPDTRVAPENDSGPAIVTLGFRGQVFATFQDAKLVMIETLPVPAKEGS